MSTLSTLPWFAVTRCAFITREPEAKYRYQPAPQAHLERKRPSTRALTHRSARTARYPTPAMPTYTRSSQLPPLPPTSAAQAAFGVTLPSTKSGHGVAVSSSRAAADAEFSDMFIA